MYIVVEHAITNRMFSLSCRKSRRSASGIQCTPVLPEHKQGSGGLSMEASR